MALYEFEGKKPVSGKETYVSETANTIGDVVIDDSNPAQRERTKYKGVYVELARRYQKSLRRIE